MSAEVLRQAAALMREQWPVRDKGESVHCQCDPPREHWFDRSVCPEPCGSMHNICGECGRVDGYCPVAVMGEVQGGRYTAAWRYVAGWLEREADDYGRRQTSRMFGGGEMFPLDPDALAVATAYLGGAQ